jgi:hypothetical protein
MNNDLKYYREVAHLIDELNGWEKEVKELALCVDGEFSAEEARKMGTWVFKLWEAAAHYKGRLSQLEMLESERFEEIKNRKRVNDGDK